jgi:hypothetical protein
MPSVYATWSGQCRDSAVREELCLRLRDLGELSQSFFRFHIPVKTFDQTIKGTILLSRELFPSWPSSPKLTEVNEQYLSLQKVTLYGLEFRLYDPRVFYPGEDRVSFVFCVDDDPQLDGVMAYVEDRQECRKYQDEDIRGADYFLRTPHVHLRYYLEEWLDRLMGWVKYHYVENLRYWRYQDLWESREQLAEVLGHFGQYEYYEMLKSELASEVARWEGKAQVVSLWPTSIRKPPKEMDDY